ncbi:virulence effector SrfC [Citrobacter farmeri]|uniref:virulence factor SrfC family protein n=1 Tax=Citrobacter farmeri TaxID=67824 RepID=UPI001904998F|nr:virulence factor SrfC family protein [Citrobacter farmeri]EKV7296664.1 virulence effector SrfC [Citrobacter farmeri]MBJ8745230.1 virulence effector SrfC [Citrobacter farmeri]MBJ8758235.1 virulence effector SrfC [Citrobacter farmeri]MBJ9016727.1 virulence effector SrfC [Citrobacter farmeri]
MSKMLNTAQAAIAWVNRTRQHAMTLDNEADALLAQLNGAAATESALNTARNERASIGLYGYAQAAKAHLLAALCSSGNGKVNVITPDRSFDYFSHLNPGHAPTNMVLRFTRQETRPDDEWPLRLRLVTEAELVQIFIAQACAQPEYRQVEKAIIESRIEKWQSLRQLHPVQGVTAQEVATIARFWQRSIPASQQQIDDALWHQFAQLLPTVDLSTRASAWSLLWGEQPELTQQWLKLAQVLQQTGHASEIAAPLSLLVDQFGLPSESFITQEFLTSQEAQSDVVVHPVVDEKLLNAVSLAQASLALLTRELVLSVEDAVLDNVDLLDIPLAPLSHPQPLWQAKLGWLLEHYRQQLQPDVLVVCNATATRTQTPSTARTLLNWVHDTQPTRETAMPGVVWAITPQDARFITQQNLDEAVQHLMGKPGQHWGTLQALDKHSLLRLIEWLSQATSAPQRQARLQALSEQHQQRVRELMLAQPAEALSAEAVVRQLQQQAAHHGDLLDGLLPAVQQFETLLRVQQPREEQVSGLFNDTIDLFADVRDAPQQAENKETGYQAHRMWLNHIRQWSRDDSQAQRLGLTPAALRQVVDILVIASYRLQLPQQLQQILQREEVCGAQLHACIANFIAWLGYADVAEADRPASRIVKGTAIFSAVKRQPMTRLTQLEAQPVHAASRYVYDWLVALYTRATENKEYQHPQDVTQADRKALSALLTTA